MLIRKKNTWLLGLVALMVCGYFSFGYFSAARDSFRPLPLSVPEPGEIPSSVTHTPSRLALNGPYGTNVSMTDLVGGCRYEMQAEHLYFVKTRMLAFENALLKKLVAKGLRIAIFKDGQKQLEFAKDRAVLKPGMNLDHFTVKHPDILYPDNLQPLRMIEIDKKAGCIYLFCVDGRKIIWDFTQQNLSFANPA